MFTLQTVICMGNVAWMDCFGLGEAATHIGTPQSIAIRSPDCAVATHLINLVDGVLCAGPSPENIASTVVDCTKIETGQIGFFRVGLIPKSKVLQIFEEVQRRHHHGQTNPAFEEDTSDSPKAENESSTVPQDD